MKKGRIVGEFDRERITENELNAMLVTVCHSDSPCGSAFVRSQEFIVAIGILVLSIVITAINPNFFTVGNLFDLLRFITVDGLLALGVLIVLISGGVDVSFPAIANFSTYIVVTAS